MWGLRLYFSGESIKRIHVAMQGAKVIAQCSRPTAVAVLSTSLSSDAGAVVCVPVDML